MKKIIELNIPVKLKDEPVIYNIYKDFDLIPNIIEASFSSEIGWAIISLEGSKEELDRLCLFLRDKEIEVRER